MLPLIPPDLQPLATMTIASAIAVERSADFFQESSKTTPQSSRDASALGLPISVGDNIKTDALSFSFLSQPIFNHQNFKITRLITSERGNFSRKFDLAQNPPPATVDPKTTPEIKVIELNADKVEYQQSSQLIIAKGNVLMRFGSAVLKADRLQVNLAERLLVAEGNVVLQRGKQVLAGEKLEYYLVADRGVMFDATGQIYRSSFSSDFAANATSGDLTNQNTDIQQPIQNVVSIGGTKLALGSVRDLKLIGQQTETGGNVDNLRFQAKRIDFDGEVWQAKDIRLTNDPFTPPELEIRADTAEFKSVSDQENVLTTTNSRLVLDQDLPLPLYVNEFKFDRNRRKPFFVYFGFDGEDKGGFFLQRPFDIINTEKVQWEVTPQYLIQKAFVPNSFNVGEPDDDKSIIRPSAFALETEFNVNFSERTTLLARANLNSLNFSEFDQKVRAKLRLNEKVGDLSNPYNLAFEYNYRDRLFNGSLGFQTVQESIGAIISSPELPIGETGATIRYQGSIQNVTAETDRSDILKNQTGDSLTNLSRYQVAAIIGKGFRLWEGESLPATKDEGLRLSPTPLRPYLQLNTGITAVASLYSNGDTQPSLTGTVGLEAQFGHLKNNFFDYTALNVYYSQGLRGNASPFKFDRFVDTKKINFGLTQQIYGPVLFGFQSSFNLDTGEQISTDYVLEYSRRTYSIILLYNPVLAIGSINLQINDFKWDGKPEKFNQNDQQ